MTNRALTPALALAAALGLVACSPAGDSPAPAPADAPAAVPATAPAAAPATGLDAVLLEGDGLMPANPGGHGTGRKLSFGEPQATVISVMTGLHGGTAPTLGHNGECGAGAMDFADWGDDLTLAFQDGKLAGWWAGDQAPAGFSTIRDIHVGSTLAQVRAAWPDVAVTNDSIGPEFASRDIYGTLSGTTASATVTALWAGVSCIFR
tara:strand:+ start:2255 stop:2872 length:618 start_codon:yes stop_codon:yes gene_type:complete